MLAVAAALGCLVLPASATADGDTVLRDCIAGQLGSSYPTDDLRDALANAPADLEEYTDCLSQIKALRDQQLRAQAPLPQPSGAGGGSGGVRAATSPADADRVAPQTGSGNGGAVPATGPTGSATRAQAPTRGPLDAAAFLSDPIEGETGDARDGGGDAGGGDVPAVPIALALSIAALTGTRALLARGRRPEPFVAEPSDL